MTTPKLSDNLNVNPTDLDETVSYCLFAKTIDKLSKSELTKMMIVSEKLQAIIARECDKARLEEVENFEALDTVGTLDRLNREVMYIDRRKAQLKAEATNKETDDE